jgi:hypothetical protein
MIRFANVRHALVVAALTLAAMSAALPAAAQLEGDTIYISAGYPMGTTFFMPGGSTVVGPQIEFTLHQPNSPLFEFEFTGNVLTITSVYGGSNVVQLQSPITFSDIDWPGDPSAFISGAYVWPGSAVIGPGNVSFTAHTLTVNMCCGVWQNGSTAIIELYPESGLVPTTGETWGALKASYR